MSLLSREKQKEIDFQFLGGYWKFARKLVQEYPGLRTRWPYEKVCEMYNLLGEFELEGYNTKKGLSFLYAYLEVRGDAGDLSHCQEYRTSEYHVMLWLMRQAEYKENAKVRRQEDATA